MKSIALALATISFASTPAMAGVYVNAESNASYTGNDFTSRTTDLHLGYEGDVVLLDTTFKVVLHYLLLMELTVTQTSLVKVVYPSQLLRSLMYMVKYLSLQMK